MNSKRVLVNKKYVVWKLNIVGTNIFTYSAWKLNKKDLPIENTSFSVFTFLKNKNKNYLMCKLGSEDDRLKREKSKLFAKKLIEKCFPEVNTINSVWDEEFGEYFIYS